MDAHILNARLVVSSYCPQIEKLAVEKPPESQAQKPENCGVRGPGPNYLFVWEQLEQARAQNQTPTQSKSKEGG